MKRVSVLVMLLVGPALMLPACGGSGVGPNPIPTPTPQVVTRPVTFVAFLDENGNGSLETNEGTRIPGVEVVAGTARGTSAVLSGQVIVQVPEGTLTASVTAASLPPFYRPPTAPLTLSSTGSSNVMVPITLPRGSNRANVYMAIGDSITNGEPEVGDGNGFRRLLATKLLAHFGAGEVANEGRDATNSDLGAEIIAQRLSSIRPSFTLILYGTNDWNGCKDVQFCGTAPSIRFMVQQINRSGGHAFVASILPPNQGYDDRVPPDRTIWVNETNVLLKQVADQEGAVYVDINGAFLRSGRALPTLFVDHLHPTAFGYELMAQSWFDAITRPYSRILSEF